MITEAQIKRHLEALQELYTVLDTHTYTAIGMTDLRKSYGIQGHTFKAMCEQEYIQKSGKNRGAKWKWGPRSEPHPHDARRVIERGLEIKLEKKNAKEPREESKAFEVRSGDPTIAECRELGILILRLDKELASKSSLPSNWERIEECEK